MKLTQSRGREEAPLERSAKPLALGCSAGFGDVGSTSTLDIHSLEVSAGRTIDVRKFVVSGCLDVLDNERLHLVSAANAAR